MTMRFPALLMFVALLAACADQATRPQPAPEVVVTDPRQRIQHLLESAEERSGAARDQLQLQAAELLLQEGEIAAARDWLQQLAERELSRDNRGHLQQLRASLLAAERQPEAALAELDTPELERIRDHLSLERQLALATLRAELLNQTGRHFASARERIFINPLLQGAEREDNQDRIWLALMQLQPEEVAQHRARNPGGELGGWLELALIARATQIGLGEQFARLQDWQRSWARHPAAARLPDGLELVRELAGNQPRQVALLLPLSGTMAPFGLAVRDGFMAAWYRHQAGDDTAPQVRIYDTESTESVLDLYDLALEQGAEAIIGPLDKQRVRQLHQQPELPVPTLALNRSELEQPAPAGLYQFSLAPEDEARQVAASAWQQRHRQALVLAPSGDANQRLVESFANEWRALGGEIAGSGEYRGQQDYSDTVRYSLNLHLSEQRAQRLRQVIGEAVEFTPRRRQDIDMVFLLARAPQARSIKPLLDFHYAGDLPVYAISRVYDGTPNLGSDRDLEGILFADMPWLLNPPDALRRSIDSQLPRQGYQRLHALGVDSFHLYPRLAQLATIPGSRFYGETGSLTLNEQREVERGLMIARFQGGTPRRLSAATIGTEADHGQRERQEQAPRN